MGPRLVCRFRLLVEVAMGEARDVQGVVLGWLIYKCGLSALCCLGPIDVLFTCQRSFTFLAVPFTCGVGVGLGSGVINAVWVGPSVHLQSLRVLANCLVVECDYEGMATRIVCVRGPVLGRALGLVEGEEGIDCVRERVWASSA